VQESALKLSGKAVVCVFIDELNTAGCLGMINEAFLSHSLDGISLPDNIFFCGKALRRCFLFVLSIVV
jgi:hypothetical protein